MPISHLLEAMDPPVPADVKAAAADLVYWGGLHTEGGLIVRQMRDQGMNTLLMGGEFDRVAPPALMRRMAGQIAGSRYVELPGIGHLMNLEAPDEFDGLLLDFLAEPWPTLAGGLH